MKRLHGSFTALMVFAGVFFYFVGCAEVQKPSPDATFYTKRGVEFQLNGQYDRAISDYNKAIEIDPEYALAYFNRGVAYFKTGDYDRAWEDVLMVQTLGYRVSPEVFEQLRKAYGGEI